MNLLELTLILAMMWLVYHNLRTAPGVHKGMVPGKLDHPKLVKSLEYAARLFKDKKYLSAEKAYLEVLKVDHKNYTAYSKLGMIYAQQRNYADAIECFTIASQLKPSAPAFHNLGLVLFENKNYVKAIAALEKSIIFEPTARRYVAVAKAYQHIANNAKMLAALQRAAELDPDKKTLQLLADAHVAASDRTSAAEVYKRILELDPTDAKARRFIDSRAV